LAGNVKITNFHKSFGASLINVHEFDPLTSEIFIKYTLFNKDYEDIRNKYIRLLDKIRRSGIK